MVLLNQKQAQKGGYIIDTLTFHYGAIEPFKIETIYYQFCKLTFHYGAIEPR